MRRLEVRVDVVREGFKSSPGVRGMEAVSG
jgi:hypothetical protein